jgi:hypothetical protein
VDTYWNNGWIELEILDNGLVVVGPFKADTNGDGTLENATADGYSSIAYTATATGQIRYRARWTLRGADLNTLLLASPVLDDVTIYTRSGPAHYLNYSITRL